MVVAELVVHLLMVGVVLAAHPLMAEAALVVHLLMVAVVPASF
jgi:hypothetical protein